MNETRTLLTETCARLFGDLVTADSLRAAEFGEWPAELWSAVEENGLTRALVPEDQGGAGLTWRDAAAIFYAAGYHAAPVPLVDTIVASCLLARRSMSVPEGVIGIATDPGLFTNPLAVDFSACDASLVAGSFAAGESRVLPQLCDSHLRHERREEAAVEASGTATGDPAVA